MTMTGPPTSRRLDQRAQRDHLTLLVAHLEQVDVLDAVAISPSAWSVDLPVAAELVEAVDVQRSQVDLQGLVEVLRATRPATRPWCG